MKEISNKSMRCIFFITASEYTTTKERVLHLNLKVGKWRKWVKSVLDYRLYLMGVRLV